MILRGWAIDGFGLFVSRRDYPLSSGLNVLFGPNEAGKTTLHSFITAMLFGFPRSVQIDDRYLPLNGGRHGGRVFLDTGAGEFTLERIFSSRKVQFMLSSSDGATCGEEQLSELLGGADAQLFQNVFAIGREDLLPFESANQKEIRERIFSAGISGAGNSALSVIKELNFRQAELFKPRARSRISDISAQIEEISKKVELARSQLRQFPVFQEQREQLATEIVRLKERIVVLTCQSKELRLIEELKVPWQEIEELENIEKLNADSVSLSEEMIAEYEGLLLQTEQIRALLEKNAQETKQLSAEVEALKEKMLPLSEQSISLIDDLNAGLELCKAQIIERKRLSVEINKLELEVERLEGERFTAEKESQALKRNGRKTVSFMLALTVVVLLVGILFGVFSPLLFISCSLLFCVVCILSVARVSSEKRVFATLIQIKSALSATASNREETTRRWEAIQVEIQSWINQASTLLTESGMQLETESRIVTESATGSGEQIIEAYQLLRAKALEHQLAVAECSSFSKALSMLTKSREDLQLKLAELSKREQAIYQESKTESQEQFEKCQKYFRQGLARKAAIKQNRVVIENRLLHEAAIQNTPLEQSMEEWRNKLLEFLKLSSTEISCRREKLDAQLLELESIVSNHSVELGRISERQEFLLQTDTVFALETELESKKEQLEVALREWQTLELGKILVEAALEKFILERQPAVLKSASSMFYSVTGRYPQVLSGRHLGEGNQGLLEVVDANGSHKSPEQLSQGTREQLYLCIRLALAKEFAEHKKALPLIFDDVLVNFDPQRAKAMLEVLHRYSIKHQVLMFTCHPWVLELISEIAPEANIVLLEDGERDSPLRVEKIAAG